MVKIKNKKTPTKTTRRKTTTRSRVNTRTGAVAQEADSIYVLKLVLYLILGSQWLRVTRGSVVLPIPLGLIIGLLLARSEKLSFDRKIQYAILLLSMFIGFWIPVGFEIVF